MITHVRYMVAGSGPLAVPFPYLDKSHVVVSVNGAVQDPSAYSWPTLGSIQLVTPVVGSTVDVYRETPESPLTSFEGGTTLTSEELEGDSLQALYRLQEIQNQVDLSLQFPAGTTGASTVLPLPVALKPLVWSADGTALQTGDTTLTGDMLLRGDLSASDPAKGSDLVGYPDPVAPSFLKTLSDIANSERVSILRAIPKALHAAIRAQTVTSDVFASGAVQALINDMDAAGYGDLYVPGGLYTHGSALVLPSNFTLHGVPGRTWFKPIATYKPVSHGSLAQIGAGKTNILFHGIGINGSYPTQDQAFFPDAIFVSAGGSQIVMDTCYATQVKGHILGLQGDVSYSGVRNCFFSDNGRYNTITSNPDDRKDGVWMGLGVRLNCNMNFVENTTFVDTGLSAVSLSEQHMPQVKNNRVVRATGGGIYLSGCKSPLVSSNVILSTGGNSIDSFGSFGFSYIGNVIRDGTSAGIMVASPIDVATELVYGVITGNTMENNVTAAETVHKGQITLHNGTDNMMGDIIVDGNICVNGPQYGFYVVPLGATNTTSRPLARGIRITSSNVFDGNTLGEIAGRDQAYSNSGGKHFYTLAAGASLELIPATGGDPVVANYAVIEVINTGSGSFGRFLARGVTAVAELADPSAVFDTTDTGTNTAIYYDAATGYITLKNRSAASITYSVHIHGFGDTVG